MSGHFRSNNFSDIPSFNPSISISRSKSGDMIDGTAIATRTTTPLKLEEYSSRIERSMLTPSSFGDVSHAQPIVPSPEVKIERSTDDTPINSSPAHRNKGHTTIACNNCKKAHLGCDSDRPCKRCCSSGKQDSCADVPQKKRGRPRLRGRSSLFSVLVLESEPQCSPELSSDRHRQLPAQSMAAEHKRADSMRSSRSMDSTSGTSSSTSAPSSRSVATYLAGESAALHHLDNAISLIPTAYLDLNLTIMKANDAFSRIFGDVGRIGRKRLVDMAVPANPEIFSELRESLAAEMRDQAPLHLAPIMLPREDSLGPMDGMDVLAASRGFNTHCHYFSYQVAGGARRILSTRFTLAKTSRWFIVMTVSTNAQDVSSDISYKYATGQPIKLEDLAQAASELPRADTYYSATIKRESTAASPTWSSSSDSRETYRSDTSNASYFDPQTIRHSRHSSGFQSLDQYPTASHTSSSPSQNGFIPRAGKKCVAADSIYTGIVQSRRMSERTSSITSSASDLAITRSISNDSAIFSDDERPYARASILPSPSRSNAHGRDIETPRLCYTDGRSAAWMEHGRMQQRTPSKRRKMDIANLLHP
ncbi:hypothetical protein ANO11243_031010 [Dothideomycetidae sp. 11243]|nr:hypothetical protein ANO11243_031010 [fungal sp. No.11243]